MSPLKLVEELADWIGRRHDEAASGMVIGFDGPGECGVSSLADSIGDVLVGLPVIRASTRWWWRPAALRLEFGRKDVDSLLRGWVDADALRRELVGPIMGDGQAYISRLRDPDVDRSVRQQPRMTPEDGVLLLDGPFLLAAELPLDALVHFRIGRPALSRALPPDRQWWLPAFDTYEAEYRPAKIAEVTLAYDHPATPAVTGLAARRVR